MDRQVVCATAALAEEAETLWPKHTPPSDVANCLQGRADPTACVRCKAADLRPGEALTCPAWVAHWRAMDALEPAALCLSGGGIRSAAFALGVIQGFAKLKLLTGFDYLSTVSGGGYTGAWLSRWLAEEERETPRRVGAAADAAAALLPTLTQEPAQREVASAIEIIRRAEPERVRAAAEEAIERTRKAVGGEKEDIRNAIVAALENVKEALPPERAQAALACGEPAQVEWLRSYSNFLTPRPGLASSDTWTGLALLVRNLLLNWLILLPLFLIVAVLPLVYQAAFHAFTQPWKDVFGWVGLGLLFLSTAFACACLPSHKGPRFMKGKNAAKWGRLIPRAIAAFALAWAFLLPLAVDPAGSCCSASISGPWTSLGVGIVVFLVAAAAFFTPGVLMAQDRGAFFSRNAFVWLAAAALGAAALAGATLLPLHVQPQWSPANAAASPPGAGHVFPHLPVTLAAVFGPLFVIVAHVLVSTLYVGFRQTQSRGDQDREWLARLSAMKVRAAIGWSVLAASALLLSPLLFEATEALGKWVAAAMTALSTGFAVLGGKSPLASPDKSDGAAPGLGTRSFSLLVSLATAAALLLLLATAAKLALLLVDRASSLPWLSAPLAGHAIMIFVATGIVVFASWRINVNRFSLHGVYRNRLVRGFLGAARASREDAEPLTGFAEGDNIRMHRLRRSRPLFHVVNVAMNLQRTTNLRWLERKAASFTFTPLRSGSGILRGELGSFAASRGYGGAEKDSLDETRSGGAVQVEPGVTLGTVMTISGAAANPGMGYHSRPATALLMTLFNVRLGAWLPNPGIAKALNRSYPGLSLRPLLFEMLGLADERGTDVYLSDGGHFENLGLYEMIGRRCRYIVISDAGCDERSAFEDLGNAVRKVGIDYGVRIVFQEFRVGAGADAIPFALGRIQYDGEDNPGYLIYLKPSKLADAPLDVRAYGEANSKFPHEPTSDQWFSESQFESYRRLGEFTVSRHLAGGLEFSDVKSFFEAAFKRGSPARPAMARAAE